MRPALIAVTAALSLMVPSFVACAASAQNVHASRYALDVAVYRDGVQTVGAHSLLKEDGTTEISIGDGHSYFQLNAELSPVQGDGDGDQLALSVNITNGNDEAMQPSLILRRGGTARMEVGEGNLEGMTNGMRLTLSPVDTTPQ